MRYISIAIGLALGLAVILGVQYWRSLSPEESPEEDLPSSVETLAPSTEVETGAEDGPDEAEATASDPIRLPDPDEEAIEPAEPALTAEESDAYTREVLSDWGIPATWLVRDDLLSRGAVVLANAAIGKLPRRQLRFMVPGEAYQAIKQDGFDGEQYFVDPASYARYNGIVADVTAIDPVAAAGFIRRVVPLVNEGIAQLGERRDGLLLLQQCFAQVLDFRYPDGMIELTRPNVLYEYADPELESLSDVQKQLLRLGPGNVAKLQAFTARVQQALFASG